MATPNKASANGPASMSSKGRKEAEVRNRQRENLDDERKSWLYSTEYALLETARGGFEATFATMEKLADRAQDRRTRDLQADLLSLHKLLAAIDGERPEGSDFTQPEIVLGAIQVKLFLMSAAYGLRLAEASMHILHRDAADAVATNEAL